ncbi:ABC transporter permease [Winogradskyella aurantia]|uniref:Transport permease protein n=1 Tax=Winogradskyella aurantia TaxID=1915063 RepID=A0A265UR07_9FLAO|nr:ABC transporter permease [Winogradskyella aurantia]OZV67724.1 ABC transporter permease [Winogradskyella aurantia]
MKTAEDNWLYTISSKKSLFSFNFIEIWRYRDLLMLFVKRDIITLYKQTILGPLWYVIQPLFTSVIFTLIFNNLGQIQTGTVPPFLFNLAGITAWNYFKECLTGTSNTFTKNQNIFGKVYFPRVIMPMSITISNLLKFGIQMLIFIGFFLFYKVQGTDIRLHSTILLFPLYILLMALLGLGFGMIISSMTTKYRDLTIVVGFGVQLLMYLSAVPYPLSEARLKFPEWVIPLVEYNPMTQIIEGFRSILLNSGTIEVDKFIYTCAIAVLVFLCGLIIFNRTEKQFIDTV